MKSIKLFATASVLAALALVSSRASAQCPVISVSPASLPGATQGQSYSSSFSASSSPADTYTFTQTGLPAGLSMSTAGAITGTPSATGTSVVRVVATGTTGCVATHTVPLTVCPAITVTPASMPNGFVGVVYPNQNLSASGGAGGYTYAVTSGSLPSGLALSSGVVSGTPTAAGPYSFTITATDSAGCTGSRAYSVTIGTCPTITVTNPARVDGVSGTAYAGATFTQSGAATPTFTIASGSLPTGMSLSTGGVLSGTPTQTGTFTITVKATDTTGCSGTGATYTFQICPTITVTNPARVDGTSGVAYAGATFTQSGATTPSFTIASGTLPTGMSLDPSTGVLGGTPTQTGTFTITVKATETAAGGTLNCSGTGTPYTFQICPTITVTKPVTTAATYNVFFSQTFTQTGATTPSFTIASGTLPAGLLLNSSTGVLSGTPTQTGSFPITVKVTETAAGGTLNCSGTSTSYALTVAPRAVADSYSNLVNNTQAHVTGGTTATPTTPSVALSGKITANDQSDTTITLTTGTFATTGGGSVTIAADGTFLYTPPVSAALTTDTFTYTITSSGISATGTVTLTLANRVWYVNASAGAGNGQSQSPWNNTSAISGTTAGDIIFIYNNAGITTNTQSKITLLLNQTLQGQGVALVVNGNTLVAAGTAPTITNALGAAPRDVVVLANGNIIQGLTLTSTQAAASLITGSPVSLSVLNCTLTPGASMNGINLTGGSGTVTVTNTIFTGTSTGDVIKSNTGTHTWTFTNSPITQTTGRALNATNRTGGGMSFDAGSTVTVSAGTTDGAITLSSNSGGESFAFSKIALTTSGTARALVATNTGTVSDTDNTSTIATADTATTCGGGNCSAAIDANGATTPTTLGLTFKSISVNGANGNVPVGMSLVSTGGALSVIGDNSGRPNASGGTINVPNSGGVSADGRGTAYFKTVSGTVTLKSMTFSMTTNTYHGALFDNDSSSGTLTVAVTGGVFLGVTGGTGIQSKSSLQFQGGTLSSAGSVTVNVQNSFFQGGATYGFFASAGGGTMTVTVNQCGFGTDINTGNTGTNQPGTTITNPPAISLAVTNGTTGSMDYTITNNTLWGNDGNNGAIWALTVSGGFMSDSTRHLNGTLSGNLIGKVGTAGSGCAHNCGGIGLLPSSLGTFSATVTNNTLQEINSVALAVRNSLSTSNLAINLHINNNIFGKADTTGSPLLQRAIEVNSGRSSGATNNLCLDMNGNTFTVPFGAAGAWGSGSTNAIRLSNQNNNSPSYFRLPGYGGAATDTAAVATFAQANNPNLGTNGYTVSAATSGTGSGFVGGPACP